MINEPETMMMINKPELTPSKLSVKAQTIHSLATAA
jgi:hypothetical protein